MMYNGNSFEIQFNFIDHTLEIISSKGETQSFNLYNGLSVADFRFNLFKALDKLGIQVKILDKPYSLPDANPITTPFTELRQYYSYQKEYVQRFWEILLWTDDVFNEFSGKFYGKTCPVHIYWHHMDMAVTRFSGKKIPLADGMNIANKDAYSHEVISFGFWAGDENVPGAAFYSYTYPSPPKLEEQPIEPSSARWIMSNGSPMALLMYDDLKQDANPRQALLDFLETTYTAGATLAQWNINEMKVPTLQEL